VPPRKKASPAPAALTDADVESLRGRVQAGEKPRVLVRAASAAVPAGTRGNIVRIGKPSEGEYVVVRLGKDEVPFAPSELAMSGRAAKTAPPAPAAKKTAAPVQKAAPARKAAAAKKASVRPALAPKAAPAASKTAAPDRTATPAASPAKAPAAKAPAAKAPAAKKAAKRAPAGRRTPPPLVVTLRFNDGEWSVEAARGARRLAKASAVRPGAVKAFADLLDEQTVRDALTETIESCRSVVEERAAALRAELLAAEAALKEYEARRR
jgi:hypothetical protein